MTSLLASLFNVVRDELNTDILAQDGELRPTQVVQPLQERTVEDKLTQEGVAEEHLAARAQH